MLQMPFYVSLIATFILEGIFELLFSLTISFQVILAAGCLISLYVRWCAGDASFSNMGPVSGPYQVGYRKIFLTQSKGKNACSVFYPVDQGAEAGDESPVFMFDYGQAQLDHWATIPPKLPKMLLRTLLNVTLPVLNRPQPSADFTKKKLIPLLFSHGNRCTRNLYFGLLREFASHGFLVISIDSHDGTCMFTTNGEKGDEVKYKVMKEGNDPVVLKRQAM